MKIINATSKQLLAAGLTLTTASVALAGSPAMTGLVGQADTAENAFTAPAALTRLDGTHITVQTMVATSLSRFDVDEHRTEVGGGNPDKGADPVIIPSLYYTRQLDDRWYAGISLTIPSGFGSDYGGDWAGRYNTVDFSLVYVALTPTVAYRVNEKLSLGLGAGINYTSETSEIKIRQPFKEGDGKISTDMDAVAFNVSLSVFYEFTERTRAGIAWTSDTDSDLEGNIKLRKLDPVFDEIATDLGIKNTNVKLTNTLPQRVLAGMYHEFESGNYFTVDGMWMKFSDFTVSDIKLDGDKIHVSAPSIYNDLWALMVGAGFPVNERTTYKVGAVYLSQGVDDDKRAFSIPLDEVWGAGVGLTYRLPNEHSFDLNATVFYTGKSPIDTGDGEPGFGRVAGRDNDPYAVLFELTYHL